MELKVAEQYNMSDLWDRVGQIIEIFAKTYCTQLKGSKNLKAKKYCNN